MSDSDSTTDQAVRNISPAAASQQPRPPSARPSRPASRRSSSSPSRHNGSVRGIRDPPGGDESSRPTMPCSAATWDEEQCVREALPTPDALRAFLQQRTSDSRPESAMVGVASAAAAVAAVDEKEEEEKDQDRSKDTTQGRGRPLLILRGLAPAFLRVLLDSPLGVDAGFVEAHAARRRYQPPPPPRRRLGGSSPAPVAVAQWNYPELVGGLAQAILTKGEGAVLPIGDILGRAAVRAVSDCEDLAAAECRASVWVGEEVDVLFLDQPVWENPEGVLKKAKRRSAFAVEERRVDDKTGAKKSGASSFPTEEEDEEEVPSLEDALQDRISSSADATGAKLVDILEEAAYDKWLGFFEVLTPRQSPLIADGSSLEWRALQALEQNLDMARRLAHTGRREPPDSTSDWPSLLQRLRDRTALLLATTIPQTLGPPAAAGPRAIKPRRSFNADNFTNLPVPRRRRAKSPPPAATAPPAKSGSDENQRALDRVTYLGAILLPISIVSSVLSMNEDFEPGHRLFWVFWVAAVPLTLLSLAVIYADKLRSAEVWEEIGSLGAGMSSVDQVVQEEEKQAEKKKEKGQKARMYDHHHQQQQQQQQQEAEAEAEGESPAHKKWGRLAVDDRPRRHRRQSSNARPQAMAYAGEDIVIDLSDAVAQSQPITLKPRTSLKRRPDETDDVVNHHHHRPPSSPASDSDQPRPRPPLSVVVDYDVDDDDEDEDDDSSDDLNMYITRPTNGERPQAWRKKQLGWAGAAMCILRMQKPLRVEDGLPVAPGPRRDVETRLRQVRRKASAEGRRSLSF